MELMVAVSILVVIILSVNVAFSGASRSVSTSQATMDLMASERAIQQMLERDVSSIDRNGFLVIRCRVNDPSQADRSYRFDQISFLAHGEFANPTGADTVSPFTDSTTSNAAHVWIGQLLMEKIGGDASYMQPNQQVGLPNGQKQLPTGAWDQNGVRQIRENEFVLGRHVSLLVPGPASGNHVTLSGNPVAAYASPRGDTAAIKGNDGMFAHITSSRYGVVAQSPSQVMADIAGLRGAGMTNPEADLYTYRFRALQTVYDTDATTNPFVNGYYRMTPVVLAGVTSFKVDWTDGKTYPLGVNGNYDGQLMWYGAQAPELFYNPTRATGVATTPLCSILGPRRGQTTPDPEIEQVYPNGNPNTGDHYVATFSYFNKNKWPKALRFTIHVQNDRLGGRNFVHVVNLPQ